MQKKKVQGAKRMNKFQSKTYFFIFLYTYTGTFQNCPLYLIIQLASYFVSFSFFFYKLFSCRIRVFWVPSISISSFLRLLPEKILLWKGGKYWKQTLFIIDMHVLWKKRRINIPTLKRMISKDRLVEKEDEEVELTPNPSSSLPSSFKFKAKADDSESVAIVPAIYFFFVWFIYLQT